MSDKLFTVGCFGVALNALIILYWVIVTADLPPFWFAYPIPIFLLSIFAALVIGALKDEL